MPQLDSDGFTYSDGALASVSSGKWTTHGTLGALSVTSNAVTGASGANSLDVISSWSGSTDDQYSQVTEPTVGSGGGGAVRATAGGNAYTTFSNGFGSARIEVYKYVSGSFTKLGDSPGSVADGSVVYTEMQGSTIIVKDDGATVCTITSETSIASGKPGIFAFSNTVRLDDWVAGDFVVATYEQSAFRFRNDNGTLS